MKTYTLNSIIFLIACFCSVQILSLNLLKTGKLRKELSNVTQATSGPSGRIWGVNAADQIFTRPGVDGTWQRIDGLLKNICVAQDGRVWGINSEDQIFTRPRLGLYFNKLILIGV